MDAVVSVGVRPLQLVPGPAGKPPIAQRGAFDPKASGILYNYTLDRKTPDPKTGQTELAGDLYLVTNKHVIDGLLAIENQQIAVVSNIGITDIVPTLYMRFNPHDAAAPRDVEIPLRSGNAATCLIHPTVDLAVCPLDTEKLNTMNINFWVFDSGTNVADRAKLNEIGTAEGDGVFVLGFPVSLLNASTDPVDVVASRQGSIARIRDFLAGHSNTYLIDNFIFPGNSGGPVILKPELFGLGPSAHPNMSAWLIGVVSEYLTYRDVAASKQTGRDRIVFEENSGLARVIPMDFVEELINNYRTERHLPMASATRK